MSKNKLYIFLCLIILLFSCWVFTQFSSNAIFDSTKIIENMYPQNDVDEHKSVLTLYRKHGVNGRINNLIKKYYENGDVKTDQKLMDFFIDCLSVKNLNNCDTIKGYPALFITVLHSIQFLPYNELIEKYPKMITDEYDYTEIKKIYICAHNMYHSDTIKMSCKKMMKTNCSAQLAPMVQQINKSIDYFINKQI